MHFKAESEKDGKVAQPTKGDITWHERSTFYTGNKRDFEDLEGIVEHETLTWETETFKQQYLPRLLEKMSLTIIPQVSLPGVHRFPGQDLAQFCQVGKGARQGGKGARQGGKGVCKVRHKSIWWRAILTKTCAWRSLAPSENENHLECLKHQMCFSCLVFA